MQTIIEKSLEQIEQNAADVQTATLNKTKYPYYRIDEAGNHVEITRSEYKKEMREKFTVKHKRIPMCQHKFVPGHEPRHRNCEHCWFVFFQVHGELTQSVEEVYQKHGKTALNRLRGPKFTDNFLKFMSTVASYKAAVEQQAKENDVSTVTTQSSNGEDDEAEYSTYAEQDRIAAESVESGGAEASD